MTALHKTESTISEEGEAVEDYLSMDPSIPETPDEYLDMEPTEAGRAEAAKAESEPMNKPTTLALENEPARADNAKTSSVDPYVETNSPTCSPGKYI